MKNIIKENITEDQFGFRGIEEPEKQFLLSNSYIRLIIETFFRINKPIYIAFVDLGKAFDTIRWDMVFHIMEMISLDFKDRIIIQKLYFNGRTLIKGDNEVYKETKIQKCLRHGCNLWPPLFNLYNEEALKDLKDEKVGGIKVNGIIVQMLDFSDDIAIKADSEESLERMLHNLDK